jgi:hypothetical protein
MCPDRAIKFVKGKAEVYASRVNRGFINRSCVEGLLRADAVHAADSLEAAKSLHSLGVRHFDGLVVKKT